MDDWLFQARYPLGIVCTVCIHTNDIWIISSIQHYQQQQKLHIHGYFHQKQAEKCLLLLLYDELEDYQEHWHKVVQYPHLWDEVAHLPPLLDFLLPLLLQWQVHEVSQLLSLLLSDLLLQCEEQVHFHEVFECSCHSLRIYHESVHYLQISKVWRVFQLLYM